MDVLEKEGAVTADRPHSVAAGDIMSGGMRVLIVGVGERLRKLRRYIYSRHLHFQTRPDGLNAQSAPPAPAGTRS